MADPTVSDPACPVSSAADLPAWLVALRAIAAQVRWHPAAEVLPGRRDRPGARLVGEVALAAGSPPAQLFFDPEAPTELLVGLGPEHPALLWAPAGRSAESLAAALLPYRRGQVPSRLQLPPAQRRFVGHTESLGQSFAELVARLAAHPALEPTGWGSAYPDDPWPRPLPTDLPAATRALLQQRYTAQSSEPPRSMTFVTRWSRSLVTLEDHAGALVLAIAHAPADAAVAPGQSVAAAAAVPLSDLPVDARWVMLGLPSASAEALQTCLQPPPPGSLPSAPQPSLQEVAASDRVTALLGLAAIFYRDLRLVEALRCIAGAATSDWALRAAAIAVAQRQGYLLLLHELYAAETDPELGAELQALTAAVAGGPAAPRPGLLLLPRAGLAPERLDALLRECGLQRVADHRRGRAQQRRWSDEKGRARDPSCSVAEYIEDHTLCQRLLYLRGPRAQELARRCAENIACWSPQEALDEAAQAHTPPAKVATLAPLVPLAAGPGDRAPIRAQVQAVLSARLADDVLAVRRGALLVLAQLAGAEGAELRAAVLADSQLDAEARSYLAAASLPRDPGPAEPSGTGDEEASGSAAAPEALHGWAEAALARGDLDAATRWLERALALEPLDSSAYLARARIGAAAGRMWSALIDVTTALAVARRQGLRLQAMQELQTALLAQLTAEPAPPTAASELHAVANLGTLLRAGRPREVEEVAELLLTLPGRAALWWLAIGLARRERGRAERASEAFTAALTSAPQLRAAHFLLGECRRELGDLEGARQAFAQLDPPAGERPPHPSLLDAYADELLGSQALWEAREHAFARVLLLRELGRPAEALAVTAELLRREPAAADALLAHGVLLVELAQPAAALLVLDRGLIALRPAERLLSEPDPLGTLQLYRAIALRSVGQRDAAAAALRHALRLSPERAAEVAADPQLAELTPTTGLPPSPPGYAVLRRLARAGLADSQPTFDAESGAPAPLLGGSAQDYAQDDDRLASAASSPDRSRPPAPTSRAPSAPSAAARPEDEGLIWTALRGQAGELLVAALAALDADADAESRRELLARAARGLGALRQLAPQTVSAQAQAVRALLQSTAAALGVAAELDGFDAAP